MRFPFALPRLPYSSSLRITLFGITLLEEMISGFPTIGLPLVRHQVPMNYSQIGLLFSVGALASMILEPICNLLSDLSNKKYWIIGGIVVLAAGFALAGMAHSFAILLFAFALIYPANDTAVGLAQAALIDENPQASTRTMARCSFIGNMGDFLAPLTVTIIAALALGWMSLCWLAAILWLGAAIVTYFQRFPTSFRSHTAGEKKATIFTGMRAVLRDPVFLRWAILAIIPAMLDEVFRAFVTLYLQDVIHADDALVELLITFETTAGFVGLLVLELLITRRLTSSRILAWSAVVVLLGMIGLLTTHTLWFAGLMLCIVGAASICWFPLAKAETYKRLPGRSGTVRAILSIGAPFSVILPSIVGFIAGRFGIIAGVGFLGLAPVIILALLFIKTSSLNYSNA